MRALLTGGRGRLGCLLRAELEAAGWAVSSPDRIGMDATHLEEVRFALKALPFDLVVGLAAWTSVAGCERDHRRACLDNLVTASVTAQACDEAGIPFLFVSSDYALDPTTVYGLTKAHGEQAALRYRGTTVARISILHLEDAQGYRWLNGVTRSSREWADITAGRLARFIAGGHLETSPRIVHLAPPDRDVTVADLVRQRFPHHPALADVVTDPVEIDRRMGFACPRDTRLQGCLPILEGETP